MASGKTDLDTLLERAIVIEKALGTLGEAFGALTRELRQHSRPQSNGSDKSITVRSKRASLLVAWPLCSWQRSPGCLRPTSSSHCGT